MILRAQVATPAIQSLVKSVYVPDLIQLKDLSHKLIEIHRCKRPLTDHYNCKYRVGVVVLHFSFKHTHALSRMVKIPIKNVVLNLII